MLDAFIIEKLRQEQEEKERRSVPLTLELPIPDEEVQEPKREIPKKHEEHNIPSRV